MLYEIWGPRGQRNAIYSRPCVAAWLEGRAGWGWCGDSRCLRRQVVLRVASGETDEVGNRRTSNEVCKQGNEEQDGIKLRQ